jgi:D-beta-D-heptose 7-phosphate kinase/D-beta-D-heptose 1-phosphate adenosyltransferase
VEFGITFQNRRFSKNSLLKKRKFPMTSESVEGTSVEQFREVCYKWVVESMREKIRTEKELIDELARHRSDGKKVVFTNGCFDLLHIGHVRYLEEAKSLGDILVVAVNSDRSTTRLKGPSRPINSQDERAEILAALACVDYVTLFDEPDPHRIISVLRPEVLVKGGDWTRETTVGREVVEADGGEVVVIPYIRGASTTGLIERIQKCYPLSSKKNSPGQ